MNDSYLSRVVESIALTTRYPAELLTPEADLENDLGIDSVKRLEIVVALSDEFGVRLDLEERDTSIRTIEQVAGWVERVINRERLSASPLEEIGSESDGDSKSTRSRRDEESVSVANNAAPVEISIDQEASNYPRSDRNSVSSRRATQETNPIVHAPSPTPVARPHFDGGSAIRAENPQAPESSQGKPLRGRVAFITGSGRGVGKTIARLLASRGATVIINSFHSREQGEQTAAEINQSGGAAIHLWGSVANPRQVDQIFDQIEQHFGRLDIMVCNASDGRIGPFMELTLDDWDRAFRTNVTGHHQCAVKAAPLMQASGGGSIVTMSAVGATGFIDGLGSQGVVKAAVETMTRYLACELGQFGIRVNCVAGGPVYGELLSKFPEARTTQEHWESITPDGKLCSPMDLANAIGFLVGDDAKGINGSVWMVDHGFSAMEDGRPLRAKAHESFAFATS